MLKNEQFHRHLLQALFQTCVTVLYRIYEILQFLIKLIGEVILKLRLIEKWKSNLSLCKLREIWVTYIHRPLRAHDS